MSEEAKAVIETRELTKRYGFRVLAVDDLDLEVRAGEIYGFLGSNGAGKTTTMRMLMGHTTPSSGNATVLGERPGSEAALSRVGALIETPAFYPYLSGRDNLKVMARYSKGASKTRIEEVLEQVGLSSRGRDKFKGYSLGMKQRLGVAAAMLEDPELLILDEPTNGLDPEGAAEMRRFISSLRGEKTVLFSSHTLSEVEQICDRVGIIRHGKLVANGTVKELIGEESLFLTVAPLEKAAKIVRGLESVEGVMAEDQQLRVSTDPARAPEIVNELVAAGIRISEVRRSSRTLEDVFLELVQEEKREDPPDGE
ncbi:MAG: ABC transporter ATP-binding protein [Rubrobacteraceae bacterium]